MLEICGGHDTQDMGFVGKVTQDAQVDLTNNPIRKGPSLVQRDWGFRGSFGKLSWLEVGGFCIAEALRLAQLHRETWLPLPILGKPVGVSRSRKTSAGNPFRWSPKLWKALAVSLLSVNLSSH